MIQVEGSDSDSAEESDSGEFEDNENETVFQDAAGVGGPRVVRKIDIEDDGDDNPLPEHGRYQALNEDEDNEYEQVGYARGHEDVDNFEDNDDYEDNDEDGDDYHQVQSPGTGVDSSPSGQGSSQAEKVRTANDRESIEAGFKVMNRMTTNDVNTLLKRLQSKLSRLDIQMHWKRQVNWDQIAFGEFSAEDCRLAWIYLKLTTRSYRNLREVVDEVALVYNNNKKRFRNKLLQMLPTYPKHCKFVGNAFLTYAHHAWLTNTDNNKKRPGSYCYFRKQLRPTFDQLPLAEKAIWEEYSKIEDGQRQARMKEFYAQFPEVPLKRLIDVGPRPKGLEIEYDFIRTTDSLSMRPRHPPFPKAEYVASKIKRLEPPPKDEEVSTLRIKYAEKWKRLSNATKVKWIDLFIQKCQQFVLDNAEYKRRHPDAKVRLQLNMLRKINRQEFLMWEEFKKKPTPPPLSARLLFCKLFSEQPQYKDLPPEEIDVKAFAKFGEMSKEEQALYRMHCVRLHEQYKREIEAYWESIPSVMKPVSLMTIPVKFRRNLTHMVEKVSEFVRELDRDQPDQEGVLTSREYYECNESDSEQEDEDVRSGPRPGSELAAEPPAKRKKVGEQKQDPKIKSLPFAKKSKPPSAVDHEEGDEGRNSARNSADDLALEVVGPASNIQDERPGTSADAKIKSTKVTPKSTTERNEDTVDQQISETRAIQAALLKANKASRRNTDDILRGIFESVPTLGTAFSPLYYYSKYVAQEKFWMKKVFRLGLAKTADLIFQSFKTLSAHQKEVFVKQSLKFHQQMNKNRLDINSQRRHNRLPVRSGVYFATEPVPPPPSLERFFLQDPRENEFRPLSSWNELNFNTQTWYMKQYFARNQKYVQDYEKFIQSLNPADLLAYVFELYKGWERNHMQPNPNTSRDPFAYLSTLPSVTAGAEQEQSLTDRQAHHASTSAHVDPRPLNNDDYISWLTALDPPKNLSIPKKVTEPEPSRREIKLQKARAREVDSDEPDTDDERIAYRGGKRVGTLRKARHALTPLERKRMQDSYERALQEGLPGLQPADAASVEVET